MYEGERTVEAFMKYASRLAKPPTLQRSYALDLLAREFYNAAGDSAKQEEVMGRANRTAQHFGSVLHGRRARALPYCTRNTPPPAAHSS